MQHLCNMHVRIHVMCMLQVYYCVGRVDDLNDLIRAGITQAETLVVVDKDSSKYAEESYMADSGSVVTVYHLSRYISMQFL